MNTLILIIIVSIYAVAVLSYLIWSIITESKIYYNLEQRWQSNKHKWVIQNDYWSECSKCMATRFREPNHGDYIRVYYTKENPFGSLDVPKCKR